MTASLLQLVQWLSPAFPTGAFAYSHGLEQVIADNEVNTTAGAQAWLSDILQFGAGWQDAVLLACALRTDADHPALATYARALCASRERLMETLDQGTAFARGMAALGITVNPAPLPVALGQAARGLALPAVQIIALYLHSFAANLVSVAVRFVPLGQSDGQRILAALHPVILDLAARAATASLDDLTTATLRADLAAMRHETLNIRIYRT